MNKLSTDKQAQVINIGEDITRLTAELQRTDLAARTTEPGEPTP